MFPCIAEILQALHRTARRSSCGGADKEDEIAA
jgi:hypothetical protein